MRLTPREQYTEALKNTQRTLEIFEEIGNRYNAVISLIQLSEIYEEFGNMDTAIECCDRALTLATELGIPLAQEVQALKERLLKQTS